MSHYYWLKFLVISFLLVSESESCAKRFKEIKRKIKSKFAKSQAPAPPQQQPRIPVVDKEPVSPYTYYAENHISDLFVELEEDENVSGGYRIMNLERLPTIFSRKLNTNETLNITFTFAPENTTLGHSRENETNFLDLEYEMDEGDAQMFNDTSQVNTTSALEPPLKSSSVDEEEEESLTDDDIRVRADWGGECLEKDWNKCSRLKTLLFPYKLKNNPKKVHWIDIDCFIEPVLCLRNGWTANRCQLMCMSKCNKEMLVSWDAFVSYEGGCRYQ